MTWTQRPKQATLKDYLCDEIWWWRRQWWQHQKLYTTHLFLYTYPEICNKFWKYFANTILIDKPLNKSTTPQSHRVLNKQANKHSYYNMNMKLIHTCTHTYLLATVHHPLLYGNRRFNSHDWHKNTMLRICICIQIDKTYRTLELLLLKCSSNNNLKWNALLISVCYYLLLQKFFPKMFIHSWYKRNYCLWQTCCI